MLAHPKNVAMETTHVSRFFKFCPGRPSKDNLSFSIKTFHQAQSLTVVLLFPVVGEGGTREKGGRLEPREGGPRGDHNTERPGITATKFLEKILSCFSASS